MRVSHTNDLLVLLQINVEVGADLLYLAQLALVLAFYEDQVTDVDIQTLAEIGQRDIAAWELYKDHLGRAGVALLGHLDRLLRDLGSIVLRAETYRHLHMFVLLSLLISYPEDIIAIYLSNKQD